MTAPFIGRLSVVPSTVSALTLLALSLATALAQDNSADAGVDLRGVELVIGIQTASSNANAALVEASGVFKDTPYTLNWAQFNGASAAVEALQAGALDINISLNYSTPAINQANASVAWTLQDRPYVVVGARRQPNVEIGVVVKPDSGIETMAGLAGKSAAFARGTVNHFFFALASEQAGLAPNEIETVLLPIAEARAAFIGGSVDALVTSLYTARPLVSSGEGKVIADSKGLFETYQWVVVRPEILKDPAKEAAVADILLRLQQQSIWQSENLDAVADIYARESRQSAEEAIATARDTFSYVVPIDGKVIAENQRQIEIFHAAGVANTLVDGSIAFDTRFNNIVASAEAPTVIP